MKSLFIIIFTSIGFLTFGQKNNSDQTTNKLNSITQIELDVLYYRALNKRFDLILTSGWHYVEMTENTKRIPDLNASERFKFLTKKELIKLSTKKKKAISLIRLNHKIVSKDTIDINFGNVSFTVKRGIFINHGIYFTQTNFSLVCGGTNGYQSDIRFVFDPKRKQWNMLTNRFVATTK